MESSEKSFFKKNRIRLLVPATIILFVSTSLLFAFYKRTDSDKNNIILQLVVRLASEYHVSPQRINDQFSDKAFDAYLKNIDPWKWFLTKEDVQQMEAFRLQIDDHIRSNNHRLYELAVSLIDRRIAETQNYYTEFLSQPFDFTADETWERDPEKRDWSANSAELKENWRKFLKMLTLDNMMTALRAQESETDPSKIKTIETIESESRRRVQSLMYDRFTNLPQREPQEKFALYLNAILSVFDPATVYRTPFQSSQFELDLSGQLEGIGATLNLSEDGYVRVERIMVGSPSWSQGELRANDKIIRVKQEDEAEPVDLFGMSLNNAVQLIRGRKGTNVTLTVRRDDGDIHEITITRDVVTIEETYARSFILTDPETQIKVGYIDLPSFYVDFRRSETGRASSDDVTEEIEKLKRDGVQGIILDLRENGGGSLSDVINMAGLFIETGPIMQVVSNNNRPRIYSDTNPAVQYDGPFVILVSPFSASASEIIASAMQDYQRAVIIGDPQTYGKGTVQNMLNLDDVIDELLPPAMASLKPTGALSLTFQKYYRITGGTVQLNGVTPDIAIPGRWSVLKIGARYDDNSLPSSTVPPARFTVWKNPVPVEMLKRKSLERMSKNEGFQLLSEYVALLREQRENTVTTLNLNTLRQESEEIRARSARFEEINRQPTSLLITATSADAEKMKDNTIEIANFESRVRNLATADIVIEEAVRVIGDMR